MKLKDTVPWVKAMINLDSILKIRGITWLTKVRIGKTIIFPVVMHGCESWTIKKAEHWTIDAFELWSWRRLLSVPCYSKEINSVNPKGNQPWTLTGRTDAEALILWPPDAKSQLIGKDPDAGKDWRQEKGMPEDKMVGWHHWLNGHEFEQTQGDSEGQRSLVRFSSWDHRVGHGLATEQQPIWY